MSGITSSGFGKTGNRSPQRAYFGGTLKLGITDKRPVSGEVPMERRNSPLGQVNEAGGCRFRFLYHTCAIHYHQAPLLISTGEGIKFVKHLSNILIRILFLVQLMYNLVSFVTRGSVRRKVIKGLLRPTTTTELAKMIGVDRAAVSRTIHAMEKVGLVECLTPDENRDRYYRISDTGKKVLAIIEGKGD